MKRTRGFILIIPLILAVLLVAGRLPRKEEKPEVGPDTPITVIRTEGTKVHGTYREMKEMVLQNSGKEEMGRSWKRKSGSLGSERIHSIRLNGLQQTFSLAA
jgi:hypothetical protein